jgi:outer membrane protein TolC
MPKKESNMKILKSVLLSILLVISQSTFAGGRNGTGPATLTLNPSTIQNRVVNNNITVAQELNAVHQAKDSLAIARGNLYPSLNLGAMASFSGGGFILSTMEFLLPFLVPSNWANYYTQKNLFEAEKISYGVIQMNTYSSVLSMYYTLLGDLQVQQIYQQQYTDYQDIYELLKRKNTTGTVPLADILQAASNAKIAGARASQVAELNAKEYSLMRQALALPPDTVMTSEYVEMPTSPWEFEGKEALIKQVNAVSLERNQIRYLLKAAHDQVWSKSFGWINMFSIGSHATGGGGGASFDNLAATGSINLGLATFPTIQLAQDKVQAIRLQDTSLTLQNTQIVESILGSIVEAKQQLDLTAQAETDAARVYQIRLQDYDQGTENFPNVISARTQLLEASVLRVKANIDINIQRVLLHRAVITDGFATIKGCRPAHHMPEKDDSIWDRIRGKVPNYPNFEDYCRGK